MAMLALLKNVPNSAVWRELVFQNQKDFLANDDEWLFNQFKY